MFQVSPDWTETGTVTELETRIGCKIRGPGIYVMEKEFSIVQYISENSIILQFSHYNCPIENSILKAPLEVHDERVSETNPP